MINIKEIDELGRISIPIEIREELNLSINDKVELKVSGKKIIITKYSKLKKLDILNDIALEIGNILNKEVIITDLNNILGYSGKKKYLGKSISETLKKMIKRRDQIKETYSKPLEVVEVRNTKYVFNTIVVNGEEVGSIIILDKTKIDDIDYELAILTSNFIIKYLEN